MGAFSIIQPQTTINLVGEPSFEKALVAWAAFGSSTIARSTAEQRFGTYSLKITPTSASADGAYYALSLTSGETYTLSAYVLGASGVPYRLAFYTSGGSVLAQTTFTGTGDWQRVEVTHAETSSTTRHIVVNKNSSASTSDLYLDAVQVERLSYATTYCDGDQDGCIWDGARHKSSATRLANYRSGGKKVDLETLSAYLVSQMGSGMATPVNKTTPYASLDGSFLNAQRVTERSLTIAFSTSGDGTAAWHANRQLLIDLVRPDFVVPRQPFRLFYDGGGAELFLDCYYDGGLEMADGKLDIETVGIKCLALNPYWRREGNDAGVMGVQDSLTAQRLIQRFADGTAATMGTAPNNDVRGFLFDKENYYLYVWGAFTSIGGVSTSYFARWDGTTWTSMTGLGAIPGKAALGPNGTVYAPSFISSVKGVAYWTGSAWSQLGGAFNDDALAVAVGPDGTVYAVGEFTTVDGGTSATYAAAWNGSSWTSLGTISGSFSGTTVVNDCIVGYDGALYVTGDFVTAGGVTVNSVARYLNGSWYALGTGISNTRSGEYDTGQSLVQTGDNKIALLGSFNAVGGINANNVALWTGGGWEALGSGLGWWTTASPSVDPGARIYADVATNFLYVLGTSTTARDANGFFRTFLDGFGVWNGASWVSYDMNTPAAYVGGAIAFLPDGSHVIGHGDGTASATLFSEVVTVTNDGSASTYPRIRIHGPTSGSCVIHNLFNLTSGKRIWFEYQATLGLIFTNEIWTLDLRPGQLGLTSNIRGNLNNKILPGSQMSEFELIKGDNIIACYATNSTVTLEIEWQRYHWSIDSSGA